MSSAMQTVHGDRYTVPTFVQQNEGRLTLDYSSPLTYEGQLLAEVLGSTTTIAAVAGMGGVGKTCALIGLADCPEVIDRFRGGIFFMSLGEDAAVVDLIRELSLFVSSSGGKTKAESMSKDSSLRSCVATASS